MADTRFVFLPESAHFPTSAFAWMEHWGTNPARPVLVFPDGTDNYAYWSFSAWQGISGALTAVVNYRTNTATTGTAGWEVSLECFADGEATGTPSFATANTGSGTVPGTAGHLDQISITLTNDDGIAAGEICRLRIMRDESVGVADELGLISVELREA
jgi:hypothetical protein